MTRNRLGVQPTPLQKDPVETTIDSTFHSSEIVVIRSIFLVSLHPQPSHDRDDICSPEQDTEPIDAGFSAITPDLEIICETKPNESSAVVCRESLCVPYTDEPDGKIQSFSTFESV